LISGCSSDKPDIEETQITLSDSKITVNGQDITEDTSQAVYVAKDIIFYLAGQDFTYGEGTEADGHEQSEADAHTVVHITKPGRYVLSGTLSLGQIAVDLGEDAEKDPDAVVTLVLGNVDITCTVAPAVIFYNVYECCNSDESTATKDVDTTKAGANVIIADGTENNIHGSYVAKIYKSYELNDAGTEVIDSKKLHKYDGAFYSKKTMNIYGGDKGDGILNIYAENEGLNSELHLSIYGGNINITSGNDGINTNEDNVSVTTMNGGTLHILCNGKTGEGDGIDSNGWLVINGGTIISQACSTSGDAGIDSDKGIYINGGEVIASGNMLDRIAGGNQTYAIFNFRNRQDGNSTYTLKNDNDDTVSEYKITNAFSYLIVASDKLAEGDYTFWQDDIQLAASKTGNMQGNRPFHDKPDHFNEEPKWDDTLPENFEGMNRPEKPNGDFSQKEWPDPFQNQRPDDMMNQDMMPTEETSDIFTIIKGENQFFFVTPVIS